MSDAFTPRSRFLYVVRSQFAGTPEQEDGWNRWYDDVDVPEMLALDGIASATRYQERGAGRRYATLYEIESPVSRPRPRPGSAPSSRRARTGSAARSSPGAASRP